VAPGDVITDVASRQSDAWIVRRSTWQQVDQWDLDTCQAQIGKKGAPRGPLRGSHVAPHHWCLGVGVSVDVAWFRLAGGCVGVIVGRVPYATWRGVPYTSAHMAVRRNQRRNKQTRFQRTGANVAGVIKPLSYAVISSRQRTGCYADGSAGVLL
jgi:hypothetical protein